jgi:hypothetical protein
MFGLSSLTSSSPSASASDSSFGADLPTFLRARGALVSGVTGDLAAFGLAGARFLTTLLLFGVFGIAGWVGPAWRKLKSVLAFIENEGKQVLQEILVVGSP